MWQHWRMTHCNVGCWSCTLFHRRSTHVINCQSRESCELYDSINKRSVHSLHSWKLAPETNDEHFMNLVYIFFTDNVGVSFVKRSIYREKQTRCNFPISRQRYHIVCAELQKANSRIKTKGALLVAKLKSCSRRWWCKSDLDNLFYFKRSK